MQTWRAVALSCALLVACGGPLPEEELPSGEQVSGELSPREAGEGELTALWKDRPALGRPRLVKDVFPEATYRGAEPQNLVSFRGKLYFAANHDDGRKELWKSNGTEAGTVVVVEFPPLDRPGSGSGFLSNLTPVGRQLFFTVADEAHGDELWVSDGTREGTRLVEDLTPGPEGSEPHTLVAVGRTLFFFRTVGAEPGRTELWTSDGTAEGTERVEVFEPGAFARGDRVAVRGQTLFFFLAGPEGEEYALWTSDGTGAGTMRLATFDPAPLGFAPHSLRVAGRFVYFIAEESTYGNELWRTDGTVAGTELVEDLTPGPASTSLQLLDVARGHLFFTVREPDGSAVRLYKLKVWGSSRCGPKLVATLPNPYPDAPDAFSFITAFATTGSKLFFSLAFFGPGPAPIAHQLWVTNGTEGGTKLLQPYLSRSDEFTTELFTVGNLLLFPADVGEVAADTELWVSDGTVKGTRLVRDLNPGFGSSYPHAFTRVGNCVFFIAYRDDVGDALWVLPLRRGTAAGR